MPYLLIKRFNDTLTNDIVSSEQLSPDVYRFARAFQWISTFSGVIRSDADFYERFLY